MDAACPQQTVTTSLLMEFMQSKIARPLEMTPPGLLMKA